MTRDRFFSSGYLFAVAAAVLWGISGVVAKFLFHTGVSPFELIKLRVTIAAVGLSVWLSIRNPDLFKIALRDIVYFALLGMIGMAGVQFTYLYAISKIHVAVAILLQYMAPPMIAMYAVLILKEKLTPRILLALVGALVGCYLVVGAFNFSLLSLNAAGILSGLLSAVAFAGYSIGGEYGMRRYAPWTVLCYALGFAALLWNLLIPDLTAYTNPYGWQRWTAIGYIGIMGTLVPFGLYLEAVMRIRSTRASITATLEPVTAGVVAFVFIGEQMSWIQLLGGGIILLAIIWLQIGRPAANVRAPDGDSLLAERSPTDHVV